MESRKQSVSLVINWSSLGHVLSWLIVMLFSQTLAGQSTALNSDLEISLSGNWSFRLDPKNQGLAERWYLDEVDRSGWRKVQIPHTWQLESGTEDYYGVAWYALSVNSDPFWEGSSIWIEFESIYRDAFVWVNGRLVAEHEGSGWTPFEIDLDDVWARGSENTVVVRVDNQFSERALPYLDSSDWAADGGIIRSVKLRILPTFHIRRIRVHGVPVLQNKEAEISALVELSEIADQGVELKVEGDIFDPFGRLQARMETDRDFAEVMPVQVSLSARIKNPALWHFDQPQLYMMRCRLYRNRKLVHQRQVEFGVRRVEVRDGFYLLNGEPMRLMGLEWMPGSDPRFGMAEPASLSLQVLRDLKRLNTVITRFHWQQADAIYEFCDREGILVQEEVPAWGPRTMEGDLDEIQRSQMQEMIFSHYNHPSIYAWGLCNEIGGQRPAAQRFVRRGIELARELDSSRILTWASNSLQSQPEKDASSLVDFIEWNDYWESWYGGGLQDLKRNLGDIRKAFPNKSLVISEYGLCECNPKNPTGDDRRIEILRAHTDLYRQAAHVAGAIFFSYNDYRTHIGDKSSGSFRQRVHGVVDLLGRPKPSWQAFRAEASPIKNLTVSKPEIQEQVTRTTFELVTRSLQNDLPAYTLRRYLLVWVAYNSLDQPIASGKARLPHLAPGSRHVEEMSWETFKDLSRVRVEVFRPTGYSVHESEWR